MDVIRLTRHKSPANKSDFVGKRFGHLTVIKELPERTSKGLVIYQCKCDCGNITNVVSNHLSTGHTQSCGCGKHRLNDLTRQTFGRLTVVEYVGRRSGNTMWRCKCSCGNYIETSSSSLHSGATKSCGCLNTEIRSKTAKDRFGFVDRTSLVNVSANRAINKNNSSGHRGVHFDKGRKKWVAQITFQRKNHLLGRFNTLEEAIEARKQGEEKYFAPYRNK